MRTSWPVSGQRAWRCRNVAFAGLLHEQSHRADIAHHCARKEITLGSSCIYTGPSGWTVSYDVVLAAAVLHHLRADRDWETAFAKLFRIVAPGGSVWITDLVAHETASVQDFMWKRYGDYLLGLGGAAYRDQVFAYIEKIEAAKR